MIVTITTTDGKITIEESLLKESTTIMNMLEGSKNRKIYLPITNGNMRLIISYCIAVNWTPPDIALEHMLSLTIAASYLNIANMLNILCRYIADAVKGKTNEEIQKMFGVSGFTAEEEDLIKRLVEFFSV